MGFDDLLWLSLITIGPVLGSVGMERFALVAALTLGVGSLGDLLVLGLPFCFRIDASRSCSFINASCDFTIFLGDFNTSTFPLEMLMLLLRFSVGGSCKDDDFKSGLLVPLGMVDGAAAFVDVDDNDG